MFVVIFLILILIGLASMFFISKKKITNPEFTLTLGPTVSVNTKTKVSSTESIMYTIKPVGSQTAETKLAPEALISYNRETKQKVTFATITGITDKSFDVMIPSTTAKGVYDIDSVMYMGYKIRFAKGTFEVL